MKVCFVCNRSLPIEEFYRHPRMGDGHLGKCKSCTKADVRANRAEKVDYYRQYDRSRSKKPHRIELSKGWAERHPEKHKAQIAVCNAVRDGRLKRQPCEVCGSTPAHGHHDDYSLPLVVRWLCVRHHVEHHQRLAGVKEPSLEWLLARKAS